MDFANQVFINALGGLIAGIVLLGVGALLNRRQATKADEALAALTFQNKMLFARLYELQEAYKRDHPDEQKIPEVPSVDRTPLPQFQQLESVGLPLRSRIGRIVQIIGAIVTIVSAVVSIVLVVVTLLPH